MIARSLEAAPAAIRATTGRMIERSGMMRELPHSSIGASVPWLRSQLALMGRPLSAGTTLSRALLKLEEFRDRVAVDDLFKFDDTETAYDYFSEAIGADFLSKALHRGHSQGMRFAATEWELLHESDPLITRPGKSTQARNRTWELAIASLVSGFASDVSLGEPDVLCTYRGKRIAIAAKIAYSEKKLLDRIKDGFAQANARADVSIVMIDVVSLLDPVKQLQWFRRHKLEPREILVAIDVLSTSLGTALGTDSLVRGLREKAKNPVGVVFFVPLLVDVRGVPRPVFYSHMPITWRGIEDIDYSFTTDFVGACDNVLGFTDENLAI